MGGGGSKDSSQQSSPSGSPNKMALSPFALRRSLSLLKSSEERTKDIISILGVQGAGKSTVMKQFEGHETSSEGFRISGQKALLVKSDILRAVILRTKVLMAHIVESRDRNFLLTNDGQSVKNGNSASQLLDDFQDEATDILSLEHLTFDYIYAFLPRVESLWGVDALVRLNSNEIELHKITEKLESAEKEQLFVSAAHFVLRINEVMQEEYELTYSDYLHHRRWTSGFTSLNVDAGAGVKFTLRDVGGDELSRANHWSKAIQESFCILFVVSLSDYSKLERGQTKTSKLRAVRKLLWSYLVLPSNPKVILLLNKRDLFHKKLGLKPLNTCPDFESVDAQLEGESQEAYLERCEFEVCKFFNKIPSSVKRSDAVKNRMVDEQNFSLKGIKIVNTFVTQANDEELFKNVRTDLIKLFSSCMRQFIRDAGF